MPRTFVVGAHISRGGAYMAYHVGRILAERSGSELVAVQVGQEAAATSAFTYPVAAPSVPIARLLDEATPADVLVCNPVFSPHQFGTRFPGRSVMYVQNVNTYAVLDGFFDHYVACSRFVRDHLALLYGLDVPVIVPFVHTERIAAPPPFAGRPPGSVAVVTKTLGAELLELLRARLAARHGDVDIAFTPLRGLRHDALLDTLRHHRYLLSLAVFEGFALIPAEAMLSGCCVTGFHGGGGLEYMRPGVNAEVVAYPRIDAAADLLADLVRRPERAAALAARGRDDAAGITLAAFEASWGAFADARLTAARAAG